MMDFDVDLKLLVSELRRYGHTVGRTIPVSDNAGMYEFEVDGGLLTLDEARALLERDQLEPPPTSLTA